MDSEMKSSGTSANNLAAASADFIAVVNQVRDAGVSTYFDLPTIVFCGKQSAGKSSLIEAMSGINLPRASGTCTRTPTELRLTNTGPGTKWECQLRLRYEENSHGKAEEPFEGVITHKDNVGPAVTRAQNKLLSDMGGDSSQMQFSSNVICVDIRGPECGDLALIDLPGLIETTEHEEDRRFIDVVRNMVLGYIKKDNAIIAMTISCKDDMENQAIKTLATRCDPKGERTIGVLTKPDTIEDGCHDQYLDVLQGRKYKLNLGYFVVKNPSQKELNAGITRAQAKEAEQTFFNTTEPWSLVDPSKRNFGADVLTQMLSGLLRGKIKQEMPKMCDVVSGELWETREELTELGNAIDEKNVHSTLMQLICAFEEKIGRSVETESGSKELYRSVLQNYQQFIEDLSDQRPMFSVSSPDRDEEEDKDIDPRTETGMLVSIHSKGLTFEDVERIVGDEQGRDLVANMSYEPIRLLIREYVKKWDKPAMECLEGVRESFEEVLYEVAEGEFQSYERLGNNVMHILKDTVDLIEQKTKENLTHLFSMENDTPFTMSNAHMNRLRKVNADVIWTHLASDAAMVAAFDTQEPELNMFANPEDEVDMDPEQKLEEDKKKLQDNESVREVVKVMSSVMAYFSIALKRFGDNVPMAIDRMFLRGFAGKVREELCKNLGLFSKEPIELVELFIETDEKLKKRNMLVSKEKRLSQAWDLLSPYGTPAQRAGKIAPPNREKKEDAKDKKADKRKEKDKKRARDRGRDRRRERSRSRSRHRTRRDSDSYASQSALSPRDRKDKRSKSTRSSKDKRDKDKKSSRDKDKKSKRSHH